MGPVLPNLHAQNRVGAPMNLPPILASCIFNLFLCLLPIAMNSSPTGHRAEDGHAHNHSRPFFFQPMPTPHMFTPPVPHFMHPPAFHPYFYPTVEIGGGLYYPMCPMPYPRSYGPQSPISHTNYRRPFFNSSLVARPTFYHSARFRHYPFRKNVTNTEVQTDSEANSDRSKRTHVAESVPCNSQTGETRVPKPSGFETNSGSTAAQRIAQGIRGEPKETEETSAALAAKSAKPGGFAFQKEKIRIECSEGAPSINVWRSFEATVPIYNPIPNKAEDRIQCEVWSVSACEGGVPFYGSFETDKIIPKTAECSIPVTPEMLLESKCADTTHESKAIGDQVPDSATTLEEVQTSPCKINESHKLPTNKIIHEASEKPSLQRCSSELCNKTGIGEDETRSKINEHIAETLNETMCEVSKSDGSLESVEEYVPSANVLAWLQNQAQNYRWRNGLPQPIRDRPGALNGSSEEISSQDEESSFDFFDAMPARKQVSYTHLMCNPHPPSASQPRPAVSGSKSPSQALPGKRCCSACGKETAAKKDKAICKNNSANRDVGSDAFSERDQLIGGNVMGSGRRKYRRISRESSSSNRNKKTRRSSDSERVSPDRNHNSRAGPSEKVKLGGFSRKKIFRRPTFPLSNRPPPEKPRGKRGALDAAKYPINKREQNGNGTEHQERQKPGQTAKPERKRKEEGKRRKCRRKATSVQNESDESVDEYWNKVGAKPKSATSTHGDAEHEKQQKIKATCKPVPLKRNTREFNEMESWDSSCLHGFQGNALRRGRTKKMLKKNSCL
ncbi:uncharacterized protein LOC144495511 [Mustelus asterias]